MHEITFHDFGRIVFQTVDLDNEFGKNKFPSGCLAIIGRERDKNLFMRFQENDKDSFVYMPNSTLGESLTIFNDKFIVKSDCISDEELSKLNIVVGKVKSLTIEKEAYSKGHFATLDVIVDKGKAPIKCLIPFVSSNLTLSSKKVVLLMNLRPNCVNDLNYKEHILCGKGFDENWEPFILTDDNIAIGTRAKFI